MMIMNIVQVDEVLKKRKIREAHEMLVCNKYLHSIHDLLYVMIV